MIPDPGIRDRLRQATERAHAAVDAAFLSFDCDDARQYTAFLRAHARALLPLEAALEQHGILQLLPDWPERRRSAALEADLADMGSPLPPGEAGVPALPDVQALYAMVYVVEGSRLGARLILGRALLSADPRVARATRYLDHGDFALWRRLTEQLKGVPTDQAGLEHMIRTAQGTYAVYEQAARHERAQSAAAAASRSAD